jgi:short-subunit dehydrogenase
MFFKSVYKMILNLRRSSLDKTFDISGKTALVTGANRGIGKCIVETFLKHGIKKVYLAVRDMDSAASLVQKHGDKVIPIHIDLEEPETIERAAKKADDVDVVVNNAGVFRVTSLLDGGAIEALSFEIRINVLGLMRMAKAFAPILKSNGGGAFVQLNSVASMKCFADFATYSASKAAAYSITQGLREILSKQGTHVVSVHPGPIDTDMAAKAGFEEISEPPEVVAEGIIKALKNGQFHLFPDQMADKVGQAYHTFARDIVEANIMES